MLSDWNRVYGKFVVEVNLINLITMVSKLFIGVVAGVTAAVGYCVYFDQKRRSDPLFRQKLRERRAKRKSAASRAAGMPDPSDPEAMQRYFMIQLQRGEACLNERNDRGERAPFL